MIDGHEDGDFLLERGNFFVVEEDFDGDELTAGLFRCFVDGGKMPGSEHLSELVGFFEAAGIAMAGVAEEVYLSTNRDFITIIQLTPIVPPNHRRTNKSSITGQIFNERNRSVIGSFLYQVS